MDESESMPALHAYSQGNGVATGVLLPEDRSPSSSLGRAVHHNGEKRIATFYTKKIMKGRRVLPPFQNMSDTIIVIAKLCIV
jgi:hypothetical protein